MTYPTMRIGRVSGRFQHVTVIAWPPDDGVDRPGVRHGVLRGRRATLPVGMPVVCVADGMHVWSALGPPEVALFVLMTFVLMT